MKVTEEKTAFAGGGAGNGALESTLSPKKILLGREAAWLFGLCFLVYFSTYLGRLNYSASLAEMIRVENMDKGAAGLIGTLFFLSYGMGQLVSGFLGDWLDGRKMICTGLLVAALCNLAMSQMSAPLAMAAIWCVNGFGQSLVWSPLLRLLSDHLEGETRRKACLYINGSMPLGTMFAYGMSALCLKTTGWRGAFVAPGIWLIVLAAVWMTGSRRIGLCHPAAGAARGREGAKGKGAPAQEESPQGRSGAAVGSGREGVWRKILWGSGLWLLFPVLCIQGALKDGVTTWVPVYLEEIHGLGAVAAVLGTMIIPMCNLLGVTAASAAARRMGEDDVRVAQLFYGISGGALLLLWLAGDRNGVFALGLLAVSTTCMMAVNTMLISVLPARYAGIGKTSGVSGILNSCVYAGSSASTYGIGALSSAAGWKLTILIWVLGAAAAWVICLLSRMWSRGRAAVCGENGDS